MNKGTKILVTVLADMALLVLVVFSVHFLLAYPESALYRRLFSALIIVAIPAIFLISYMTFAGDRFDYNPEAFEEEEQESADMETTPEQAVAQTDSDSGTDDDNP